MSTNVSSSAFRAAPPSVEYRVGDLEDRVDRLEGLAEVLTIRVEEISRTTERTLDAVQELRADVTDIKDRLGVLDGIRALLGEVVAQMTGARE